MQLRDSREEPSEGRETGTEKCEKEAVDAGHWSKPNTASIYPDISEQSLLGRAQTVRHVQTLIGAWMLLTVD